MTIRVDKLCLRLDGKPDAIIKKKDLGPNFLRGGQSLQIRCRLEILGRILHGKSLAQDMEKAMANLTDFTMVSKRRYSFVLRDELQLVVCKRIFI